MKAYRWNLEQFLVFVRKHEGMVARIGHLGAGTIQAWMDHMAQDDLALSTMRARQSTLSSFCAWLVKRDVLPVNPLYKLERPRAERTPPRQVPAPD